MHTLKSLGEDVIPFAAREANLIVTVEEYSAFGGLGSAVAGVLAAKRIRYCSLLMLNLGGQPLRALGSQIYLRRKLGIDSSGIAHAVRERLKVQPQFAT